MLSDLGSLLIELIELVLERLLVGGGVIALKRIVFGASNSLE